ncbi:MAG: hypothetical protein ABMA15_05955 [Vicinamibacterales bacterium]
MIRRRTHADDRLLSAADAHGVTLVGLGRRHDLGLLLWACATLLLELSLTRVLSVALWYHFGVLVISTALLGFGAAGTTLSVWPFLRERASLDRALAVLAATFAVVTVVAFRAMQYLPFDPFSVLTDRRQIFIGPVYYLLLAAPFFCAGLGLALLFTRGTDRINRLYACDLTGAGLGCLLLLAVMPQLGGAGAVLLAAALGLCASAAFASGVWRGYAIGLCVASVLTAGATPWADHLLPINITPLKVRPIIAPLETHWNTSSRVEVFQLRPRGAPSSSRRFVIDGGTAGTGIQDLRPGVREYLRTHPDDAEYTSGVAYVGKSQPDVLVIGSGGGAEVLDALHFGARRITAVEVNPSIVDVVSRRMADYWGGLFQQPEVRLVQDEGRSFLRRSQDHYDAIISIHTISNAAVASGAMSLTENYVLTREAFEDYLDHLTPDGMILFSRPEPQIARLVATAREALNARGVDDTRRHVYAFRVRPDDREHSMFGEGREAFEADVIVKKSPITAAEIAAIEKLAGIGGDAAAPDSVVRERLYSPDDDRTGQIYREILGTQDLDGFYATQRRQMAPATDDRPFFNHLTRWSSLDGATLLQMMGPSRVGGFMLGDRPVAEVTLVLLLAQTTLVAAAMILWPLARMGASPLAGRWRWLAYFAALGFGFITVEMALISRMTLFLGQPAYTIALVLGGLLVFTGAGAALAGRFAGEEARAWRFLTVAIVVVLLAETFGAPTLFARTLGAPFLVRCLIALCAIAPVGVLLGMPFPAGLRLVSVHSPALVPWAWGVNGFFTVIGTVSSLMLAMTFGFTVALLCGTACYVVALTLMSVSACERGA